MVTVKPAPRAVRRSSEATYETVVCDTGLTRYAGDCRQFPPAELAGALAADSPLYLLADNRRLQDAALTSLPDPHYLFDWLGPSAAGLSPLVILPGEVADAPALIGRGWRRDGVIGFFAKEAGEAAVQALRTGVRAGQDRVLGICWPTILFYLLNHYQPDFVNQLMAPFACILLEDPVAANRWQLFAAEPLDDRLQALGLKAPVAAA
jgi:hypothetical protein